MADSHEAKTQSYEGSSQQIPWWLMPLHGISCLALDAPLVAITWWMMLHQKVGLSHWRLHWALFFAVWFIYLFDRLFDARRGALDGAVTEVPIRKQFAQKYSRCLMVFLCCAFLAALGLAFTLLVKIWYQACLVGAVTIGYFLFCRVCKLETRWPIKESLIGFCFAAGIGIPYTSQFGNNLAFLLLAAALFTINCLLISKAEVAYDRQVDPTAWFVGKERWRPTRGLSNLLLIIVLAAIAFSYLGWGVSPLSAGVLIVSSLGLLILGRMKLDGVSPHMQPLADACLWLPALTGIIGDKVFFGVVGIHP